MQDSIAQSFHLGLTAVPCGTMWSLRLVTEYGKLSPYAIPLQILYVRPQLFSFSTRNALPNHI